jgi:CheY-like chemotaxis protein
MLAYGRGEKVTATKRSVLVVDDSPGIRHVVKHLLEPEGLEIVGVGDGRSALEESKRLPGLAMILCDVNMPGMNGMDLLTNLKADPLTASIPVLMMTALDDPATIAQARSSGAVGWISKPFAKGHLEAAVRKLLERMERP